MASYKTHRSLLTCMATVPLAEAWLLNRARANRTGSESMSLGEEDLLDQLANHPLFKDTP